MDKVFFVQSKDALLSDLGSDAVIFPHRLCVVSASRFLDRHIGLGHVSIVSELPAGATDKDWEQFLLDSGNDVELAKASFLSFLNGETEDSQLKAQAEAQAKAEAEVQAKAEAEAQAKAEAEAQAKAEAEAQAEAKAEAKAEEAAKADAKKK